MRSAISIVPQSPDLFEGTVRENIDPVGEHSDADIWVALEQAHLKEFVEGLPGALDARVQEGVRAWVGYAQVRVGELDEALGVGEREERQGRGVGGLDCVYGGF